MFDVYSEINVRYILKYVMHVPVVATNNQLLSRNLISHQALIPIVPIFLEWLDYDRLTDYILARGLAIYSLTDS